MQFDTACQNNGGPECQARTRNARITDLMEELKQSLLPYLKTDFEKNLLEAAIRNLEDGENKLRLNNFAYAARELTRHFLRRLENELHVDLTEVSKNLRKSINDLSKYTHVEPETFDVDETTIVDVSYNIMEDTLRFFMTVTEAQIEVMKAVDACINEEMASQFFIETKDELDILASHYEVLGYLFTELTQLDKDDETITMKADGVVQVRLQYGSDGDMRRGDGYETVVKFPFTSTFVANYKNQDGNVHIESANVEVDNDTFFE